MEDFDMKKLLLGSVPLLVLAGFVSYGYADCYERWGNMMYYGHGGMGIMWILFVAIIVVIALWAVREMKKKDTPPPSGTPLDILKRRYAKGELTKEQFQDMKKDIEG